MVRGFVGKGCYELLFIYLLIYLLVDPQNSLVEAEHVSVIPVFGMLRQEDCVWPVRAKLGLCKETLCQKKRKKNHVEIRIPKRQYQEVLPVKGY